MLKFGSQPPENTAIMENMKIFYGFVSSVLLFFVSLHGGERGGEKNYFLKVNFKELTLNK